MAVIEVIGSSLIAGALPLALFILICSHDAIRIILFVLRYSYLHQFIWRLLVFYRLIHYSALQCIFLVTGTSLDKWYMVAFEMDINGSLAIRRCDHYL